MRKATAGINPQVPVGAAADMRSLAAAVAKIQAQLKNLHPQVPVGASTDSASVLAAIAAVEAKVAAASGKVRIGADISGVPAAVAQLQRELKALSAGHAVFADMLDLNVPQGQLVGQLLLLRRLIQQSGVSDMLGVNLNTSELRQQLEKLASLSENINVGANTGSATSALTGLRARIAALGQRLIDLRINADDTQAESVVARLQARLAALSSKTDKLVMSADTSQLDAQIAAETAKLATLQRQASDLQLEADATGANLTIGLLEKKLAALYKQAEDVEIGGDATLLLTRIYAVEARLALLNSDAKTIELNAKTDAINAAITATAAKITGLKQQAADIRLGANVDTAGLAAADAGMLALEAATEKLTPAADQAGGAWSRMMAVFATTGGGWGATIGGISVIHIVLDLAIEAAISLGAAMLALGAAAVAVYPSIDQLSYGLQHSLQAMTALGVDAGPLAGKLDQLQKSVVPQVYEAFGGALNLITGQTGALADAAHNVVNMFDTWIAKIDLWAAKQNGINGILRSGTGYLSQFGRFIGILVQALDNLLTKDPGIARYLLDILQGVALLIDAFSRLPGPVVEAVLALHGLYLWGSVFLGIITRLFGPIGNLVTWIAKLGTASEVAAGAAGVGGLGAAMGGAATKLKAFGTGLLALASNPLTWAVVAAAGVAYLAYTLVEADNGAKGFISSMETALNQLPASQALSQISADVGQLRTQLDSTQAASGKLVLSLVSTASNASSAWNSFLHDAPLTNNWFKDLGSSALNALHTMLGFQSVGPQMLANGHAVSEYTGAIVTLSHAQSDLFFVLGRLITGQNKFGIGALSAAQAIGLMDAAGVQTSDTVAIMTQKIDNLVKGYKAMSIQGGLLSNSINALNFQTAQQDSKVTQLNSAWDTFFKTVSGGASGFSAFATQSLGLYTTLGGAAASLSVSSGRATIRIAATTAAVQKGTPSITGLTTADLALRDSFLQTADAANTQMDNLTLLASAAGLGSKGTDLLTQATRDMVAQMLPAAKGSAEMTTVLYALAQRGGYQGADSFKALAQWVGNTKNPMADLDKITSTLTVAAGNLTKDVQNLSIALGTNLTDAMARAILQATGGQQAFDDFANAILKTQYNSTQQQSASLALAQQLVDLTGNTKDAHDEFLTFAQQLNLSQTQAQQLWNEIQGKLTPSLGSLSNNVLPSLQTDFENWANDGLNYGKTKADSLWQELVQKLGPALDNMGNLSVPNAKAKFVDWAEHGLKLTQAQAQTLWQELVIMQKEIDSLHGTTLDIKMNGLGQYTIQAVAQGGQQLAGPVGAKARALGGIIDVGSGPTADDVLARVSRGEYVIQAAAVRRYGKSLMDQINTGRFAGGGLVPGYAAGGMTGNLTPAYIGSMYSTFQSDMTGAMISAMRAGIKAAQTAATATFGAAGAAPSGANASGVAALQAAAAKYGWNTGGEWNALNYVEMREAGYNLTATNPTSGAYGMAQFINGPSEYYTYGGNPNTYWGQAVAMVNYIRQRYGDPIGAAQHEQIYGWYKSGGLVPGFASGGVPGAYFPSTPALRSALAAAQRGEAAKYYGLGRSFTAGPEKYLTASVRHDLGVLAVRQRAELAAYNALSGTGLTPAHLAALGAAARAETAVAARSPLSRSGAGGHPLWAKDLRGYLATLAGIGGLAPPGSHGTGPGGLPAQGPVLHIYGGDVVTGIIGRALAEAVNPFGAARGALVMDRGGWLAPGPNLAWNMTGRREHLTPDSGTQKIVVELNVTGSDQELTSLIRKIVKLRGGGSAQKAFGQH